MATKHVRSVFNILLILNLVTIQSTNVNEINCDGSPCTIDFQTPGLYVFNQVDTTTERIFMERFPQSSMDVGNVINLSTFVLQNSDTIQSQHICNILIHIVSCIDVYMVDRGEQKTCCPIKSSEELTTATSTKTTEPTTAASTKTTTTEPTTAASTKTTTTEPTTAASTKTGTKTTEPTTAASTMQTESSRDDSNESSLIITVIPAVIMVILAILFIIFRFRKCNRQPEPSVQDPVIIEMPTSADNVRRWSRSSLTSLAGSSSETVFDIRSKRD